MNEQWKLIQRWAGVPADGVPGPQTARAIIAKAGIGQAKHTLADPAAFFAKLRERSGPLDQIQVDTVNRLLISASHWPVGWLAYGFATAWHEARLRPIDEIGKGKGRPYAKPGARMKAIPNAPTYGGQLPYGRGLVQLTWAENYEWADKAAAAAGLINAGDILANFDLVKKPAIAAFVLVQGMEDGAFTGKKLADYIGERGTHGEFKAARKIINGTDRDEMIASYADEMQEALDAGMWR